MMFKKIEKLRVVIFYLLIACIPLNLGKHFVFKWSYVNGILVDYLIPTVYITDLLMGLLLLLWVIELYHAKRVKKSLEHLLSHSFFQALLLLTFSLLLSVLTTERLYSASYAFSRFILNGCFFIYVYEEFNFRRNYRKVLYIIGFLILLESLLSLGQWFKQSSVFNNYLFFGEQPYHSYTPYIVKENFFGVSKIPPYGTFRHPNVLGAFLSIILLWMVSYRAQLKKLFFVVFPLGTIALFLTYSKFSWVAFVFGLVFYYLISKFRWKGMVFCTLTMVLLVLMSFVLPFLPKNKYYELDPSFFIRAELLSASYKQIPQTVLFGCGFNNSSVCLTPYLKSSLYLNFIQPVHNIYILVFLEAGIFSFLLFIWFLSSVGAAIFKAPYKFNVFYISFMQILILGAFDHYFFTAQSAQIIFWLTISFLLKYNLTNEEK